MAWQALFPRRVLLSTLWLFILPIVLDVRLLGLPTRDEVRDRLHARFSSQVGVREATGRNDGEVEAYLAITNLEAGHAWCGAFISWVFAQEGFDQPRTPWTPALFPNRCTRSWKHRKKPQKADVFGLYIPHLERIGHAGFVEKWGEKFVTTIEGNTNLEGNREGDGVYRKRRRTKNIHTVADWVECNKIKE